MSSLLIPYAFDASGYLVSAAMATRDVDYFCPVCNEHLILRDGEVRTRHFAHKTDVCCFFAAT